MKNTKFLPNFLFAFFTNTMMALISLYISFAIACSDYNFLNWNLDALGFFGVLFFLSTLFSISYSLSITDESEIAPGDIPSSYSKKTLYAFFLFICFSIINFLICFVPFAIGNASVFSKNWKFVESTQGYASNYCVFLMFIGFLIVISKSLEIAEKNIKTKWEVEKI